MDDFGDFTGFSDGGNSGVASAEGKGEGGNVC